MDTLEEGVVNEVEVGMKVDRDPTDPWEGIISNNVEQFDKGERDEKNEEEEDDEVGSVATVGNPFTLDLELPSLKSLKSLKAKLIRPTGKTEPISCKKSRKNTLLLEFVPTEPGKHIIEVIQDRRPVAGSPFEVMVEGDEALPKTKPTVGNPFVLDLDIPSLTLPYDLKSLKAILIRPTGKEEPIQCEKSPKNTLLLEFVPTEPGKHVIKVTQDRRPVTGSPFEVMVEVDKALLKTKATVGNPFVLDLDIPSLTLPYDLKSFKATLIRPTGKEEPIQCEKSPKNTLLLEFVPTEPGEHVIEVIQHRRPVTGSPFKVMVEVDEGA